jgi:hypothetical protein
MQVDGMRDGVALSDIQEGEELLNCPWALVIGSTRFDDQSREDTMCAVVRDIEAEL